jgi:hypothetical protein
MLNRWDIQEGSAIRFAGLGLITKVTSPRPFWLHEFASGPVKLRSFDEQPPTIGVITKLQEALLLMITPSLFPGSEQRGKVR